MLELKEDLEESNKKLKESLASNQQKSVEIKESNIKRVDNSRISDCNVKIYLDNNLSSEYAIDAQMPLTSLEVSLGEATTLKIEITSEDYVNYGFVNLELQ